MIFFFFTCSRTIFFNMPIFSLLFAVSTRIDGVIHSNRHGLSIFMSHFSIPILSNHTSRNAWNTSPAFFSWCLPGRLVFCGFLRLRSFTQFFLQDSSMSLFLIGV